MADNVGITPGSGAKAASREVTYSGETAQVQVVGLATFAGADDAKTVADVSSENPVPVVVYGEMLEALEALRFAVASLTKTIGYALPNTSGQPIMEARQATAANLNATVSIAATQTLSTVTTVSTVSTLTNQSQAGGFAMQDYVPAIMHLQADNLRRNIAVT